MMGYLRSGGSSSLLSDESKDKRIGNCYKVKLLYIPPRSANTTV